MHFSGLLDVEKEKIKIDSKMSELKKSKAGKESRFKNQEFLKKAPKEVVDKERSSIKELDDSLQRLEKMRDELR